MATGPSVNNITKEEWKYLKDKNTLAFAGFPFSLIKTKYYLSVEGKKVDKSFIDTIFLCRYLDTKLLLFTPSSIEHAIKRGFNVIPIQKGPGLAFNYRGWFMDEEKPPCEFKKCRAFNFNQPLFKFRGQLSAAINAALVLGATEIRLVGVDMNCMDHFYDNRERWSKDNILDALYQQVAYINDGSLERKQKLKPEMFKDFDPKKMHTTSIPYQKNGLWNNRALRGMPDCIQWMDQELRKEGLSGIYTTSKKSALYIENKLQYKKISDP